MANKPIPQNNQNLFGQACLVIDNARTSAYRAINERLVKRNWLLGKIISEDVMQNKLRSENYGANVIGNLAKELTAKYGKGFGYRDLYRYMNFYNQRESMFTLDFEGDRILNSMSSKSFEPANVDDSEILTPVWSKSLPNDFEILHSLNAKSPIRLSWSHYRILLQVDDADAREWYERETLERGWGVRKLQEQVSRQDYYRTLSAQRKALEKDGIIIEKPKSKNPDIEDFIKNPVVGEFLGFKVDSSYLESDLEQSIIDNIERFMLEIGKGFAFMERQQPVHTEKRTYYIDLVLYNVYLKSYVLIDIKTSAVTHQDVGQMDMYVRMYDEHKRRPDDNPTIGILLCADTDEDIARYSVLHDNDHLFASKYLLYMPTQEQLRREIERQKALFYLKQAEAAQSKH